MSFRKKNEYSENQRFETSAKKSNNSIFWQISSSIYEKATIITNLSITIILICVFILNIKISVNKEVVPGLIQIATSFGALSLAIPLFLKDFKIQKILWLSFLTLTVLFIFSTVLGIILRVFYPVEIYELQFPLIFVVALIFSFNIRTVIGIFRLRDNRRKQESFTTKLRPSEIYDFIGILVLIIVSFIFGEGVASPFFILFFYSISVLLTVILSSVITTLSVKPNKNLKFELKQSIQKALENKPDRAFTEQQIIDELRNKYYNGISEQVSRTSVLDAISEMDSEIDSSLPVVTIYSNNLIIPRWNDIFKQKVYSVIPNIIFLEKVNSFNKNKSKKIMDISENEENYLISYLSKESHLSFELLKDGNALDLLINQLSFRKKDLKHKNIFHMNYILAHNSKFINKDLANYLKNYHLHLPSVSDLYQIFNYIENNAYISQEFSDSDKFEMIREFIETELFANYFDFEKIFSISKVLDKNEIIELLYSTEQELSIFDIEGVFKDKFFKNIPSQSLFNISVSLMNRCINKKLKALEEAGIIECIVPEEGDSKIFGGLSYLGYGYLRYYKIK